MGQTNYVLTQNVSTHHTKFGQLKKVQMVRSGSATSNVHSAGVAVVPANGQVSAGCPTDAFVSRDGTNFCYLFSSAGATDDWFNANSRYVNCSHFQPFSPPGTTRLCLSTPFPGTSTILGWKHIEIEFEERNKNTVS